MKNARLCKCDTIDEQYCPDCSEKRSCPFRELLMYCQEALKWYNDHLERRMFYELFMFTDKGVLSEANNN